MSIQVSGDDDDRHVDFGDAPGDEARAEASMLVMQKYGPPKLAVYVDSNTDEWVECAEDVAVEVRR